MALQVRGDAEDALDLTLGAQGEMARRHLAYPRGAGRDRKGRLA